MNAAQATAALQIDDYAREQIRQVREHKRAAQFLAYHAANPMVWETLKTMALERKARGFAKAGIKALMEVARWNLELELGPDADGFKVNNDYAPLYGRLLEACVPELRGFFEFRSVQAAQ